MPQRKPTTDEYHERIELVRSMLVRGYPKQTIKKAVRRKYGDDLSHVSIEKYFTRARTLLAEAIGPGAKRKLREDSLGLYQAILADPKTPPIARIKAQERIDKLMGLEDKSNTPPLEVFLGSLPADVADAARRLLSERLRPGGVPGGVGTNGTANGHA